MDAKGRGNMSKQMSKKNRELYDLLEQVSGMLSNPEIYGLRAYYAMAGTEARQELERKIEKVLEPYRAFMDEEYERDYQREIEDEYKNS